MADTVWNAIFIRIIYLIHTTTCTPGFMISFTLWINQLKHSFVNKVFKVRPVLVKIKSGILEDWD